jgi:hypothetical protein
LPDGARLLASSVGCRNQGFIYGERVIGLQFHMETTPPGVRSLVQHCSEDLSDGLFVQPESQILDADAPYDRNHQLLGRLLDQLDTLE